MDRLRELATKEFEERHIEIEPMFPRILVRVLPKEQVSRGGIVLTDHEQNKPVHEGIVLRTYKPFWQVIRRKMEDWMVTKSPEVHLDENENVKRIWQECCVQPGDHVLFPHMAQGITPVWPLDGGIGQYRLIEEGHVLSRLGYQESTPLQWLVGLLAECGDERTFSYTEAEGVAIYILEHAHVIRKDQTAKTLSGV